MAKYQIRYDGNFYIPYRRLFGIWWDLSFWCQGGGPGDSFIPAFHTKEDALEWLKPDVTEEKIVWRGDA